MTISRRRRMLVLCSLTAAGMLGVTSVSTAERSPEGPELHSFPPAIGFSMLNPDVDAPGTNDWSCLPTSLHPRPVVLVHGTWENRYNNFAELAPALKRDGYCVFGLDYGDSDDNGAGLHPAVKGTGDIRRSAAELAEFVDEVLAATDSSQVDIVGHSQGGVVPRQYLKAEGGADPDDPAENKVRNLVTLGATHHGTTLSGIATLADHLRLLGFGQLMLGEAATQQARGSEFMAELNAAGDTVPGVDYHVIATRYDEVTTPYESTFLAAGPGATVRNITLQDGCAVDASDHLSMTYSGRAIDYVKQSLDPTAPEPRCEPNPPVF
ncbi:alpha/beta fold hydrolase [Saccharopolyspora sp. NPDC050389]|uniref:esterase/lipase family protein n=1 Tax=Saccharopolyspora sp. NPDC050389 TaxID=3155516 RepID=UPI0033F3FA93